VLEKVEGDAAAKARVKAAPGAGCGSCAGDWRGRSEAIFPIYVMGSSRGSTVAAARGIVDSPEDPIWVAVKAEAKSEVSMLPDLDWLEWIAACAFVCATQMTN
jgi:serine O-acetyltransferase